MTGAIKDGGPAFPVSTREADIPQQGTYGHQDGCTTWQFGGLTMRDYFAAKAMAALIVAVEVDANQPAGAYITEVAYGAYEYADAMIKAREA